MRLAFTFLAFTLITTQDTVLSLLQPGASYWTKWLNRDNATGYGDEETYEDFATKPCREATGFTPVRAQCRIKRIHKPWFTAEKFIEKCYACTAKGILCSNQAQGCGKDEVCCPDYEIRFLCYKEVEKYWTSWLDRDNPTATGDYETYDRFYSKPCREGDGYKPVEARCRIKQTRRPWYTVKKVMDECYACTAEGIACVNNKQNGCSNNQVCCPDYEIQFLCYKASNVYSSCSDALQKTRNAKNGLYLIRNSSNSFAKTYCQMTSLTGCSGGGWTLVMKIDGRKETFKYSSSYWQNKQSFNPAGGLSGLDNQETKLPTYWSTSFKELCVGMKVGNDLKFVPINYPASSLYDLVADGKYRATSLGRQKWKSLISGSSMQRNCNKEGFNAAVSKPFFAKTRIGFIGNQENNCGSPDSYLGFGGPAAKYRRYCGVSKVINTCGNSAICSPDNGNKEIKAMGYIFVR